jgi:hypothetical protein
MCEAVCGPAEAHPPDEAVFAESVPPQVRRLVEQIVAAPIHDLAIEDASDEPIEIVDEIRLEGPVEIVPPPRESGVVPWALDLDEELAALEEAVAHDRRARRPIFTLDDGTPLRGVEDATEAEPAAPGEEPARLVSTPPPPIDSPFESFLQTLSDVACESGHTFAASEIERAMAGDPVAAAWRAILDGESEDFSLCAMFLDEWSANLLARIVAAPHKAQVFRRELRARGVAAFGLVEAAA